MNMQDPRETDAFDSQDTEIIEDSEVSGDVCFPDHGNPVEGVTEDDTGDFGEGRAADEITIYDFEGTTKSSPDREDD